MKQPFAALRSGALRGAMPVFAGVPSLLLQGWHSRRAKGFLGRCFPLRSGQRFRPLLGQLSPFPRAPSARLLPEAATVSSAADLESSCSPVSQQSRRTAPARPCPVVRPETSPRRAPRCLLWAGVSPGRVGSALPGAVRSAAWPCPDRLLFSWRENRRSSAIQNTLLKTSEHGELQEGCSDGSSCACGLMGSYRYICSVLFCVLLPSRPYSNIRSGSGR